MFSLKKAKALRGRSSGFTIVELLIVIVVIGILATLVIVTFSGIQQKGRDSQRKTDINAMQGHVEAFYAQYGFYPTLADLNTASFRTDFTKGLDPEALVDPKGGALTGTSDADQYGYTASGTGCTNTTATTITSNVPQDNGCTAYALRATLEGGGTYDKQSN